MNGIQIYRELSPNTPEHILNWLEVRQQIWPITDPKGVEHLFIDNDKPRDADITPSLVSNTVGFALFDGEGEYIGSYRSLDRAITAQKGAKIVVTADVEDAEPDEIITATDDADI